MWHDINYTLFAENLVADLNLGESLSFVPTGIQVKMTASDGETEVGMLGQTFSFDAPATGSGTLGISASYALTGILFNSYDLGGSLQFETKALELDFGSTTTRPGTQP